MSTTYSEAPSATLAFSAPVLVDDGIRFSGITAEGKSYDFLIKTRSIDVLSRDDFDDLTHLEWFQQHQFEVHAMATRFVRQGVDAETILLKAAHFESSPWRPMQPA